jgi:hypothetical protein
MSHLHIFLLGATSALSVVAALFFLRNWRTTHDRFYVLFASAFLLMAANWALAASISPLNESRHWIYALRLLAFLVIIAAIIDKNRASRS